MTLAWGSVGSLATLVSGGGRRGGPASPAPPDVERDRTRIAPGVGSRACKNPISIPHC